MKEKEAAKSMFGNDNEAISKFFAQQYGSSPFKEGKGFDFQCISAVRKTLEEGLNTLIRALEIYLSCFVEQLHINKQISEIKDIDYVISFNYTHTFSTVYKESHSCAIDYIHGEAKRENTIEKDTMVLGINEYLSDDRKDKDIDFIAFKKFYQTIYKGTGCEYKNWIYQIKEKCKEQELELREEYPIQIPFEKYADDAKHNLYIFGHSLDVTDKDILRELILNDNMYTTIYYHKTYDDNGGNDNGRKDLGSKIANLVKVIGQDELIRRTGGSTKTIEFKLQQDMVEI